MPVLVTAKFAVERKLKSGRPWFFRTEGMVTLTSTAFFRPRPVKWTRKTKTVISFLLCISIWQYSGLSFWWMKIMSLTFQKASSQNCLVMKKRFWREKRILLDQWSRISQEALIGCFSPLRSDQPASKRCSKRCLIQFFNNRASGQLSVSKRTVSAWVASCEQKRD